MELLHYWSRDERFLVEVKLPRTARIEGWHIDDARVAFFETLFNDIRDVGMRRFAPELRRRVFGDPGAITAAPRGSGGRPRRARARRRASPPR